MRTCLMSLASSAFVLSALPSLVGCTGGYVRDADSKSSLSGVTAAAGAECGGNGCQSPTGPTTTSNSSGLWAFDAYGNINGNSDIQIIDPLSGHETINLVFIKSNYLPLVVYQRQVYNTYTINNTSYVADLVNPVYLCPVGSLDSDGDSLCDSAEASYGTNPNSADSDGDGIDDASELHGGAPTNIGDGVDLGYYGANPNHRDVFIYYNYYTAPSAAALAQVVTSFANAPVSNPDGKNGISLHLINGGQIAAADQVQNFANVPNDWSQFDTIKNKYYPSRYAAYMHYMIFANQYSSGCSSGISRGIPAHDFMVTLGCAGGGSQTQQSGTLMHEFGHNLGLHHGGNEDTNYKANYLSIMNYRYQLGGLTVNGTTGLVDYSRFVIGSMSESAVNEQSGMSIVSAAGVIASQYDADFGRGPVKGNIVGPIDFNQNSVFDIGSEAADLDGDGLATHSFAQSQNDWTALVYTGAATGGGTISGNMSPARLLIRQDVLPENMVPELEAH